MSAPMPKDDVYHGELARRAAERRRKQAEWARSLGEDPDPETGITKRAGVGKGNSPDHYSRNSTAHSRHRR